MAFARLVLHRYKAVCGPYEWPFGKRILFPIGASRGAAHDGYAGNRTMTTTRQTHGSCRSCRKRSAAPAGKRWFGWRSDRADHFATSAAKSVGAYFGRGHESHKLFLAGKKPYQFAANKLRHMRPALSQR